MNTRIVLSAALAAGIFFAFAPAQAQAPSTGSSIETSRLETKIAIMQQQINALQSQIQQLQTQLRAVAPSPATGPVYQIPNLPKFTVPNMTLPNNQQTLIVPHTQSRNGSIPDYTATFIMQPAH